MITAMGLQGSRSLPKDITGHTARQGAKVGSPEASNQGTRELDGKNPGAEALSSFMGDEFHKA